MVDRVLAGAATLSVLRGATVLDLPVPPPGGSPVNVLIVHAHPEPRSFCAALRDIAVDELTLLGHDVLVSDLYADGFDARLSAADFVPPADPAYLRPMEEQAAAVAGGTLSPDVAREVARFREADLVILNAPMWWYSVPAILKGWFDRVLVNGVAYEDDVPAFVGRRAGKGALLTMTTTNTADDFRADRAGALETVLHPILHGVLAYCRLDVHEPFLAYGADVVDEATRLAYLAAYRGRLRGLGG
jgi:NAD(P)H dehydrogenase (quinone)